MVVRVGLLVLQTPDISLPRAVGESCGKRAPGRPLDIASLVVPERDSGFLRAPAPALAPCAVGTIFCCPVVLDARSGTSNSRSLFTLLMPLFSVMSQPRVGSIHLI